MRVLVVEDEPDLLKALVQSLREAGYATDGADTGTEGLFKAESCEYEAIILDLMLPGLGGLDLLRTLREKGRKTPILVLTARDTINDRVRGLDAGADDYLIKPFALTELLARVRALIRRNAGRAHPVISLGDVVIDTSSRTVTRSGAEITLTAREYARLELLAIEPGRLVTRTMIYEQLFSEEEDDTLSNVVEVHMSHLRKKLGKDLIHTRRGLGYQVGESESNSETENV